VLACSQCSLSVGRGSAADAAHFRPSPANSGNFLTPSTQWGMSALRSEFELVQGRHFQRRAPAAALILRSRRGSVVGWECRTSQPTSPQGFRVFLAPASAPLTGDTTDNDTIVPALGRRARTSRRPPSLVASRRHLRSRQRPPDTTSPTRRRSTGHPSASAADRLTQHVEVLATHMVSRRVTYSL
jgi:hypothetical protein